MDKDFLKSTEGDIRYGFKRHENPKGTVVICEGYRQIIEQYEDIVEGLFEKGFSVYVFDWKGQGGSSRHLDDSGKVHSDGFEEHIETLDELVKNIVVKEGKALILMAHSMGGNIALRYLKEHPGVFDKAVLVATMIDINESALPKSKTEMMDDFIKAVGNDLTSYAPEHHVKNFERNGSLFNRETVRTIFKAFRDNPELKTKGPTMGFLRCVIESINVVKGINIDGSPYISDIKTPIIWFIPEEDKMVCPHFQKEMVQVLENAVCVYTPGGHNSLFSDHDNLVKDIDEFVAQGALDEDYKYETPLDVPA